MARQNRIFQFEYCQYRLIDGFISTEIMVLIFKGKERRDSIGHGSASHKDGGLLKNESIYAIMPLGIKRGHLRFTSSFPKKVSEDTAKGNRTSHLRDGRLHIKEGEKHMNWNEYVEHVKLTDPDAYQILDETKAEAAIISAMIEQRKALGLSQRDLAAMCEIPQSSVARIESCKTTPKLDTILKIFKQLGLVITISPIQSVK